LTIFTMVAFSLIVALNAAMDAAMARNQIEAAMQGIDNQLTLLRGARIVMVDKDLPDDGSGILYHVFVRPEQVQDQQKRPVVGLYRATVTAKWNLNGTPEDRAVSLLLFQQ